MSDAEQKFSELNFKNRTGLNKEFEKILTKGRKNIKTKLYLLTERLDAIFVLSNIFNKNIEVLEIWVRGLESSIKDLKKDAEIVSPELLFEIQVFEIKLLGVKKVLELHK